MRALRRIRTALRSWLQPDGLDAEVDEELRFHVDREVDANLEAGMTPDEARRAAHVTIGNISAVRERSRAGRSGALLHQAHGISGWECAWRARHPASRQAPRWSWPWASERPRLSSASFTA